MAAIAEKEKTKAVEEKRETPRIPQSALKWNNQTSLVYREAFVRLPEGFTLQDLNDAPDAWHNIQSNRNTALQKWDVVRATSFDESWFVDATVSFADRTKVIFAGIRKTDMPTREVILFEDEMYKVAWMGSGYGVYRKSDDVLMGAQTHQNPEAARHFIMTNLYSKAA
ncbi:hypothetical protein [Methyloceanibacter sp.]|uniref:hypothetical protein n=1 Tax=Methyloceanibacter sp. TaxID=1965321 RepID=UPI002BEFA2F2|nr:hypothetical protein [Methyloceanibacter sp.]HML93407.1 hypothetical protein [Methyloceanibacter sp.]